MTDRAEVASALEAARRRRAEPPTIDPPPTLFDNVPPAEVRHHANAGEAERRGAAKAAHNARSWKGRVFAEIRKAGAQGLTNFEIFERLGGHTVVDFFTIQPRTTDLRRDGLIVATDQIRASNDEVSGRTHEGTVFVATEWSNQ